MATDRPAYQVVFLIDLPRHSLNGQCDLQNSNNVDRKSTVSLCIFRVLSHLLSKIQGQSGDDRTLNKACRRLRWGCKFFDSQNHTTGRVERSQFKSFKLKHFEVFEKEVARRLCRPASKVEDGKKRQKCNPSESVRMVLSEVFSDFQWERPDLMSPGRPHRRKGRPARWGRAGHNSSMEEMDGLPGTTRNLLFVLSDCPQNEDKLKTFCGKKCIDADVFLDSVLQSGMLEKLRGSLNLDVFWVDTNSIMERNGAEIDARSVSKVNEALNKVGGQLIPLEAILRGERDYMLSMYDLRVGSLLSLETQDNLRNTQPESWIGRKRVQIIPVSSSLDFFLQRRPSVDLRRRSVESVPAPDMPEQEEIAGTMFIKDGNERKALCKLNLQHATRDITSGPQLPSNLADNTRSMSSIPSHVPPEDLGNTNSKWADVRYPLDNADTLITCCSFHIQGALPSQVELVGPGPNNQTFICCGQELEKQMDGPGKKATTPFLRKSRTFEKLMTELNRQQKVLILSIKPVASSSILLPCLAVLHPCTRMSGLLNLVPVSKTLHVEKQLLVACSESEARGTTGEDIVTGSTGFYHWRDQFIRERLKQESESSVSHRVQHDKPQVPAELGHPVTPFDGAVLERWYPSGHSERMANLVLKLSERVNSVGFLDKDEKQLLKQVQKLYRKENQPLLQQTLTTETKPPATQATKTEAMVEADDQDEVDGAVGKVVVLEKLQSNTNIVKGCRSEKMLTKGIQKSKKITLVENDGPDKTSKKERSRPDIGAVDFRDEEELLTYLMEAYDNAMLEEGNANTCVQTVILVALHFLKTSGADNPEMCMKRFMEDKVLLNNAMLRQKHNQADCELSEGKKIFEYKLQIQLHFEVAAAQTELDTMTEEIIEEVCNMLRKLSISGQLDIKKYLEDVLVEYYIHALPKSLAAVYRSLTLPLPHELAKLVPSFNRSGDQSSFDDSCFDDSLISPGSEAPSSMATHSNPPSLGQPLSSTSDILISATFRSQKSRKLIVHPSLSDIGPKRQIMVQKLPVNKQKLSRSKRSRGHGSAKKRTGSARKRQGSARKSQQKEGSTKKIKEKSDAVPSDDTDMKAVRTWRRNLFMTDSKLERRQSVAVMENLISPRRRGNRRSQQNSPRRSPRVKSNAPNMVAETPAHKQLPKRLVVRSHGRRGTDRGTSAPVVEESPMKVLASPVNSVVNEESIIAVVKCPTKSPTNVALPRRTFYSAGPRNRSRNMEKYRQLADRIAGRTPSSREKLKSPARQFFVKQLKGSPSPSHSLRRTPRKPEVTPVKGWATTLVMDSPSQNTRSRTPSRSSVNLELYQDQHAPTRSGRTPRKETVTRKLALNLSPEKTASQNKTPVKDFPQGLTAPKWMETQSRVNQTLSEEKLVDCMMNNVLGTPKRDKGTIDHRTDSHSVLNSPSQNTRSGRKPSPGSLLSRHLSFDVKPSSGVKPSMGIRNLSFDLDMCPDKTSVPKTNRGPVKSQATSQTPVKESRNTCMVSCERTPQKFIETTPRKSCLKTPNHYQSASKSPHSHRNTPPTPASILKKTGFSPGFGGLSPRPPLKVRWKEDELPKVSNLSERMAKVENLAHDHTSKEDHYERKATKSSDNPVKASSCYRHDGLSTQTCLSNGLVDQENYVQLDQTSAKPSRTVMTTPSSSPVRKVKVKTPDTLDQWPRRKPRFGCERGSSISPKTSPQQSSVSPGSDTSGPTFRSENTTPEQAVSGKRPHRWRSSSNANSGGETGTVEELKSPKHCSSSEYTGTVPGSNRVLISTRASIVSPEDSCARHSSTQDSGLRSACYPLKPVALSFNIKSSLSCGASDSEPSFNEALQRKRVLPDAFVEQQTSSPLKRPRTAKQQKSVSNLHQRIIQHEHTSRNASSTGVPACDFSSNDSPSLNEDYFSSMNEEVFLSDKSAPSSVFSSTLGSPIQSEIDPTDALSQSNCPINSAPSSTQSVQSNNSPKFPRLRTLRNFKDKTLSSGSESGLEPGDSNSPIFSQKQSTPFVRTTSNNLIRNCAGVKAASSNVDTDEKLESPIKESTGGKNQVSPSGMKTFSPNVSAKGLLQLMNSPLLRSGLGKRNRETMQDMDFDASLVSFSANHANMPANSRKRRKVVARSRRSLNLFN